MKKNQINPTSLRFYAVVIGLLTICSGFNHLKAQQDPMFTKYMFNSLVYNPAYAGSNEHMAIAALLRTQWIGVEGAPRTQTLTLHTPLKNDRVGIGGSIINDKIGPTQTLGFNLAYAYRIPIGKGKLAIGLQGGVENYQADWTLLDLENPNDPSFDMNQNRWLPNFGAGIYYSSRHFYAGFSSPHLIEYDLRENIQTNIYARQARHYYFSLGGAIPLQGDALVFKPSILVKNVGLLSSQEKMSQFKNIGAPTEFDIDLSLLFQQTLWVGLSFRSALEFEKSSYDSGDIWVSWFMPSGLRVGAAYDYPLTELSQVTNGSFELMVGYEFNYRTKKIVTPRYF
ncbi:MAG: type IX secretion system membrane protein PorP/SprF [Saprospiraceae bacterium]|nr:type IX secretion system membrane protein PorP/SprF [Saprospiraceae bacterium]